MYGYITLILLLIIAVYVAKINKEELEIEQVNVRHLKKQNKEIEKMYKTRSLFANNKERMLDIKISKKSYDYELKIIYSDENDKVHFLKVSIDSNKIFYKINQKEKILFDDFNNIVYLRYEDKKIIEDKF